MFPQKPVYHVETPLYQNNLFYHLTRNIPVGCVRPAHWPSGGACWGWVGGCCVRSWGNVHSGGGACMPRGCVSGVCMPGGVCAWVMCMPVCACPGGHACLWMGVPRRACQRFVCGTYGPPRLPPVNRITDVCENITFPQLRLLAVINHKYYQPMGSKLFHKPVTIGQN